MSYKERLQNIKTTLDKFVGQKVMIESELDEYRVVIKGKRKEKIQLDKAHEIIRIVGKHTQDQLIERVTNIASMAMEAIFGEEAYKLHMEFVERRGKNECVFSFEDEDGFLLNPLDASGIGLVDVASFALRVGAWVMKAPQSDNVIILDEPMKHVSEDLQEKASAMIKDVSVKLGIQFIIVTHQQSLASFADKVFEVKKVKKVSIVNEL
jgi:DNA repair exonuclease SbcCD ATPase subunit